VLESDRPQTSGVDESPITVQRKGSRAFRVHNDSNDFADPRAGAVAEKRVEQASANAAPDGVRYDVHRILHGVPVSGSGLPRGAVRVADDLAVEAGGQKRQPERGDGVEPARPLGTIGSGEFERGNPGSDMVRIDIADHAEVVGRRGPDRNSSRRHDNYFSIAEFLTTIVYVNLEALGNRIQSLRVDRGLKLRELADRSDVSVSMLSSVERGEKAPTVVVLDRIAAGLDVTLASLVAEDDAERIILRRAADQDRIDEPGGWQRTILSPVVPGVNFEWIRSTLPPGCEAGTFPAYAAGSHEFVAVQSGTLTLTIGGRELSLSAGDSVYFAADSTHGYANWGQTRCIYYVAALIMRPRAPGTGRAQR
jgi:XRE family transcriptional regulator, regulator of sulfur utilization